MSKLNNNLLEADFFRYRQIESYFTKQNMCVFVYAHVLNNTDSYKMAEKNILKIKDNLLDKILYFLY